jgi:hypothetical protein
MAGVHHRLIWEWQEFCRDAGEQRLVISPRQVGATD